MLTSINVKFIFDSARLRLFRSANILHIVDMMSPFWLSSCCSSKFLAIISPSAYFCNE